MVEITYKDEKIQLSFPANLFSKSAIEEFVDRLKIETIAQKSELTSDDVTELSSDINSNMWNKIKHRVSEDKA